jgi:SAM-dependent methyltransferase
MEARPSTPSNFNVATEVRDFYERYPYPPPLDSLEAYQQVWRDPRRRRADFHLFWPTRPCHEDFSILIAGCGTSQAPKHAIRWPAAEVTGIDFSAASVRHALELKRKYNLPNLEVRELSLERVGELGKCFDQIVCTGVLHHLADPNLGLRALRDVLKPEGAMHLMVYAPYGRHGIYILQQFCRRVGIPATDHGVHQLLGVLKALPSAHPLASLLHEAPDFRTGPALADALLNPHDRAYSVPELFELLEKNGLTFGRWVRQAPYSIHCGALSRISRALRMAEQSLADQYAAAELFRGTIVRHSAVVYRDDHPCTSPIHFTGDAWLAYVPIRIPEVTCIHEQLPPGSVGLLRNSTHAYGDIYLPIGAREKRQFEEIDGKRSVGELLGYHAASDVGAAFFERLWWHDCVVFDASAQPRIAAAVPDQ